MQLRSGNCLHPSPKSCSWSTASPYAPSAQPLEMRQGPGFLTFSGCEIRAARHTGELPGHFGTRIPEGKKKKKPPTKRGWGKGYGHGEAQGPQAVFPRGNASSLTPRRSRPAQRDRPRPAWCRITPAAAAPASGARKTVCTGGGVFVSPRTPLAIRSASVTHSG